MQFKGLPQRRKVPTLTPLIDIVFLLLVFFLLTAHFVKDESLDITLPEAESSLPLQDEQALQIVLDKDGRILLQDKPVAADKLTETLRHALQGRNNKQVLLRGDQAAQLGLTVKVMDAARKAGAESLDIITQQP